MPITLKHQASQAIVLLLTCIALIGYMGVELSADHEDCNKTICAVCSGFNEDDPEETGTDRIRRTERWSAPQDLGPALRVTSDSNHSTKPIRAPPLQF